MLMPFNLILSEKENNKKKSKKWRQLTKTKGSHNKFLRLKDLANEKISFGFPKSNIYSFIDDLKLGQIW